jgi:energy-coupling factor transport system ATP-binding protein
LDWTVREEVLGLLDQLARERALLVVTHEPELFAGRISEAWQLVDGSLGPLPPTKLLTMPPDGSS